jgi:hypothetical protein
MHFDSPELAWAIAGEWDAQVRVGCFAFVETLRRDLFVCTQVGKRGIEPGTMPLMSLTSTWLDQTVEQRDIVIRNVGKYLHTDTCCFYAEPTLRALRKRQSKAFKPLHEWMEDEWNCELATTDEVFRLVFVCLRMCLLALKTRVRTDDVSYVLHLNLTKRIIHVCCVHMCNAGSSTQLLQSGGCLPWCTLWTRPPSPPSRSHCDGTLVWGAINPLPPPRTRSGLSLFLLFSTSFVATDVSRRPYFV